MTNKRELKKNIKFICGDLFAECIATSLYSGKPKKDDVDALLQSIIATNNEFIKRVSHPEPGMTPKKYFNDLKEGFNKQIVEIIDQIGNLN